MDLKDTLSYSGTLLSLLTCVAPLPGIVSKGKAGKFDQVPKDFLYLNHATQFLWLLYSLKIDDPSLKLVNTMTSVLSLVAVLTYAHYARLLVWMFTRYLILSSAGVTLYSMLGNEALGTFAVGLNMVTFAAPCKSLGAVVSRKDSSLIDPSIALCNLVNCFIWTTYAYLISNSLIMTPNIVGLAVSLAQMVLYYWATNVKTQKIN